MMRKKKKTNRKGVSGTAQLIRAIARREKLAPPPPRRTNDAASCAEHCFETLGFSSPWALVMFCDTLFRSRTQRRAKLPRWKTPKGTRCLAVRCRCDGRDFTCPTCGGHGYGFVFRTRIKKAAA